LNCEEAIFSKILDLDDAYFVICEEDKEGEQTEIGAVLYETDLLGTKGPRQMTIVVPNSAENAPQTQAGKDSLLFQRYKSGDKENLISLRNKDPKWSAEARAYVLDFNNRVSISSVKNFQLVNPSQDAETIVLQIGRVGKNAFSMDFPYPLSPLQAMAICLSSCDNKIIMAS